jgi:hypothetical protein
VIVLPTRQGPVLVLVTTITREAHNAKLIRINPAGSDKTSGICKKADKTKPYWPATGYRGGFRPVPLQVTIVGRVGQNLWGKFLVLRFNTVQPNGVEIFKVKEFEVS